MPEGIRFSSSTLSKESSVSIRIQVHGSILFQVILGRLPRNGCRVWLKHNFRLNYNLRIGITYEMLPLEIKLVCRRVFHDGETRTEEALKGSINYPAAWEINGWLLGNVRKLLLGALKDVMSILPVSFVDPAFSKVSLPVVFDTACEHFAAGLVPFFANEKSVGISVLGPNLRQWNPF